MSAQSKANIFLERSNYRQRRLQDAARLLPVVGIIVVLIPLLWSDHENQGTSFGLIYIFGAWALLVIGAGYLSRKLHYNPQNQEQNTLRSREDF